MYFGGKSLAGNEMCHKLIVFIHHFLFKIIFMDYIFLEIVLWYYIFFVIYVRTFVPTQSNGVIKIVKKLNE